MYAYPVKGYGFSVLQDGDVVLSRDEWNNSECMSTVTAIQDGFATGTFHCTKMPMTDKQGCAFVNGLYVCRDQFAKTPLGDGFDPFCQEVQVSAKSIFEQGIENTSVVELDQCKPLVRQSCTFVSSTCASDARGQSGRCYANELTYDCGKDIEVTNDEVKTETTCKDLACFGEECINVEVEQVSDYSKIWAMLQVAQVISQSLTCSGLDPNGSSQFGDPTVDCTIMDGMRFTCSKMRGSSCCKYIAGYAGTRYLKGNLLKTAWHLSGLFALGGDVAMPRASSGERTTTITGNYSNASNEPLSLLYKPLTKQTDNLQTSGIDQQLQATETLDTIQTKINQGINDLMVSIGLRDDGTGGDILDTQSGMSIMGATNSVFFFPNMSELMEDYFLLCKPEEIVYQNLNGNGLCINFGEWCTRKHPWLGCMQWARTACCYPTLLHRFLIEEIRKKFPNIPNNNFGTPQNPNCRGIDLNDLDKIDWDQIYLQEWVNQVRAQQVQLEPSQIDIETTTGSQSWMNYDSSNPRKNALERTQDKIAQVDPTGEKEATIRCMTVNLDGSVSFNGPCKKAAAALGNGNGDVCLKNGQLASCAGVRSLSASQLAASGYECFNNGKSIDCSKLSTP